MGIASIIGAKDGQELCKYLETVCVTDKETERKKEAKRRLDLYMDRGRVHFEAAIDDQYKNAVIKKQLKEFLKTADFQNVTRRIVREISTVYSEPAVRKVKDNDKYQEFIAEIRQDRSMRKVNRLGNLLRDVLVWPRVRDNGYACQEVVPPSRFWAVPHPDDPLQAIGFVLEQFPASAKASPETRHYLAMDDEEFVWLSKGWNFLRREPHPLKRIPALLWSKEDPDDSILDGTSGADIPNAHVAVTLLNARMLKHQKSGTKMAAVTGDTSGMARGQPMDEETVIEAPEGVAFQTLDLGADPQSYIDTVNSVIKQVAANHGIPMSVFDLSYQATSGFEINLKRSGLREIRADQILDFRPFEKELATLWAATLDARNHRFAFNPDGWSIEFGDTDTPDSPMDRLEYWKAQEDLDLINRVDIFMKQNPEATEEVALATILKNQEMRIDRMRDLQRANGGGLFGLDNQAGADDSDEMDDMGQGAMQ